MKKNESKKGRFPYRIYKVLSVILAVLWTAIFGLIIVRVVEKKYYYPLTYYEIISQNASAYDIDKRVILSVIKIESSFNEKAESKKGAKGLMQIKDSTAVYIAQELNVVEFDLFEPETNINFGCYYLNYLLNKFELLDTALVAYNAGEGKVKEWLKNSEFSVDGKTLNKIPYSESEKYIERFYKTFKKYEKLYGNFLDK